MLDKTDFVDKELVCVDCGATFTFTNSEQLFYWSKGLSEPKRCKKCRMIRRRSINVDSEERNGIRQD